MADETRVKILDLQVKYEDAIAGMAKYQAAIDDAKKAQENLKLQLRTGKITQEEYNKAMQASKVYVKQQKDELATLSKHVQNQVRETHEQEGSLKQLRAQLSNATAAFDALSKAEREGAKGQSLRNHINEITTSLKEAEASTQRYYRNVGNYENALKSALGVNNSFANSIMSMAQNGKGIQGIFQGAASEAKAFGSVLMEYMTNPVFLALAGIAGAGMAVKWFYDYNQGLAESTRLTKEFLGLSGDELSYMRNEIQATADTYGKDYKETLESVDVLTSQYGMTAQEALDVINKGFQSGADLNGNMIDKIKQFAPAFHDAGIAASDMVGLIQQTRSGIFGDDGMELITKASQKIREMSSGTASALESVGINSKQLQKDLSEGNITMFEAVQKVAAKMQDVGVNSQEAGEVIKNVFGKKGAAAGQEMIKSLANIDTNLDNLTATTGDYGAALDENRKAQEELNNATSALFEIGGDGLETITTQLKTLATKWLTAIIKGIIDVINYVIDLYNESTIVRGVIQAIITNVKNAWEIVVFAFNAIVTAVKSAGRQIAAFGKILEGVFTLSWDDVKAGVNDLLNNVGKTFGEQIKNIKQLGNNVGKNYLDGINETIKGGKLEHITIPTASGDTESSGASSGGGSKGGGGGKGKTDSKAAKAAEQARKNAEEAAKKERELVYQAEQAMTKLMGDSIEIRKKLVTEKYEKEITDLKLRLTTEKNLTVTARQAINTLILAKEQEKVVELGKMDDAAIKEGIERNQRRIALHLQVVMKGSAEELELKKQQIAAKQKLDLQALDNEKKAAEKANDAVIQLRQQQLADAQQNGGDVGQAQENLGAAYGKRLEIIKYYEALIADIKAVAKQQEADAQRAFDEAQYNERQQVLQNELDQLSLAETQKESMRMASGEAMTAAEKLGVDIVTQAELDKLDIEQQMAQQRLDFIIQQGQLETETRAQYDARVLQAQNNLATAEAKNNQARLKNHQAYQKSMSAVGQGLIDIVNAVGQSDENFAKLSKIITLAQIAIDTGKAISGGVANAMELPYPANLAAMATTVATVLANIATAVSTVKSANFAEGGHVYGPGTGTSDSVPANLSNGEFVMTAKATKLFEPLLLAMNGIGKGAPIPYTARAIDAEARRDEQKEFAMSLENIHPVVSVEDINEGQQRVSIIESLGEV